MVQQEQQWVEKYRPQSLKEVACQEASVKVLESTVRSQNVRLLI